MWACCSCQQTQVLHPASLVGLFTKAASDANADDDARADSHADADAAAGAGTSPGRQPRRALWSIERGTERIGCLSFLEHTHATPCVDNHVRVRPGVHKLPVIAQCIGSHATCA